jgi:hypothetical protein
MTMLVRMNLPAQSQTPINLNALFGFSENDLLVNRSGQLTIAQQTRLKRATQVESIAALIALLLLSIPLPAFREEQSGILLTLIDFIIVVLIVAIPFLVLKYRHTMRDIEKGIAKSVTGGVLFESYLAGKLGERNYYLVVKNLRFKISEKQQLPFIHKNRYQIFYANTLTGPSILSIEVVKA